MTVNSDRLSPGLLHPIKRKRVVAGLLTLQACLLAWQSWRNGPDDTELARLSDGLQHWSGELNAVHPVPPLISLVGSLPLLVFDVSSEVGTGQKRASNDSVGRTDTNLENADRKVQAPSCHLGRLMCIPLTVLGGWICYRWGSDLFGGAAGVLATVLWVFWPVMLSTSPLERTAAGAAPLALAAAYMGWRWLKSPDWTTALLAGLASGLAMLAGFEWIGLLIGLPLLWLVARWRGNESRPGNGAEQPVSRPTAMQLVIAGVAAVYAINLAYLFEGTATPLAQFRFTSQILIGPENDITGYANRFHDGALRGIPVPLPQPYVLRLDAWLRELEACPDLLESNGPSTSLSRWLAAMVEAARHVPLALWLLGVLGIMWPTDPGQRRSRLDALAIWLPMLFAVTLLSVGPGCPDPQALGFSGIPFALIGVSGVASSSAGRPGWQMVAGVLVAWYVAGGLWAIFGVEAAWI